MIVRAREYPPPVLRRLELGDVDMLALIEHGSSDIRLIRLGEWGDENEEIQWSAHDHPVSTVAQRGDQLWTGDSRGVVRVWDASRLREQGPKLIHEIRLRAYIVAQHPLQTPAVLVATDSGLVQLALQSPLSEYAPAR
jgi:hypothetical protein